jgi:hypothetical protein
MREIILTGYDNRQFKELVEKEESAGCYLCKRDSEGIFLMRDGEKEGMGNAELHFKWFEVIEDDRTLMFALCNECYMLLRAFAEKFLFEKEFEEFDKSEDK